MNSLLDNISVILDKPRYPENIGAAARCCRNMGIGGRMYVVKPELPDIDRMLKMATHEAADIIADMLVFDSLKDALSGFGRVFATSARTGRKRMPTHTPREAAREIVEASANNKVALLFGSEKCGLQNADLELCHAIVNIPSSGFSSINLAQSVMILAYEVFLEASLPPQRFTPALATLHEMEGMYQHIDELFSSAGLIMPQNPDHWIAKARQFLNSRPLKARDVRMIRSCCRQLLYAIHAGVPSNHNETERG